MTAEHLPVHGFVLAGGRSSRMARDKALLEFCGRTMLSIALSRIGDFCAEIAISGVREDLAPFAPIVAEPQTGMGPVAGLEAGLRASSCRWALFTPVDVPLVPGLLLRNWASAVMDHEEQGARLSYLLAQGERQPTFCLLHRECLLPISQAIQRGERRLGNLFHCVDAALGPYAVQPLEARPFLPCSASGTQDLRVLFSNINTPEDLSALETLEGTIGFPEGRS